MSNQILKYTILLILSLLLVTGCAQKESVNEHEAEEHGHGHGGGIAVTEWQDSLELFAEWPPFVAGHPSEAVIHFTDLRTFNAVIEGPLDVHWAQNGKTIKTEHADTVTRTGIFIMELTPPSAGTFELVFALGAPKMNGTVTVANVIVHANEAAVPHEEETENPEEISFLKEQQWKLHTQTAPVERRMLYDNVRAPGELEPAGNRASEVYAPFAGVLMPDHKYGAVRHGQEVTKGQALAMISPAPSAENSWYELLADYRLAKAEHDRVSKLASDGAVSGKRLEEAQQSLATRQAQLQAALGGAELEDVDTENPHFTVRAPRSGVITHHSVTYGSFVPAGQRLFSVIDPSVLWLEVHVPAVDAQKLRDVSNAFFSVGGSEELYSTVDLNGRVVAAGSVLDPETRRVPVIFELENREGKLNPGAFAQVYLRMHTGREAIAIPRTAIVDDEGTPVAFIQVSGESFVRRVLQTGIIDGQYVEVLSGVEPGERVVSDGAYKVKLASLGTNAGAAHGHAH